MALPPKVSMNDYHDTWIEECDGEDTELARAAFYQFLSRDEDTLSEFVALCKCNVWFAYYLFIHLILCKLYVIHEYIMCSGALLRHA